MFTSLRCSDIAGWEERLEAVSADQRERYERHLETCTACQDRLDRTDDLDSGLRMLGRQLGDPTLAPVDPTLSQLLDRLHGVRSLVALPAAGPPDLYFLRHGDRPDLLGLLGAYEVQEVIGQGGMGLVLKAFDPALNRLVAIKVMADAIAGSATARRRFAREAQAAAAVCHDHVVTVHGVHEANGLPYLVMQYVAGESLQARLDRTGPLEVIEVVRIGLQTASGLAAAHAQGLIHRDIKPANLLLENGLARVKITDFGLARMADDVGLTQAGVVAGTPEYMAPEQARGEAIDHRADLFSLGSVLYFMCTGRPPFRAATAVAVLRRVSDETPKRILSLNPDVPAWLEAFIARLMAKDPAGRLQSAAEAAELLESYLAHLSQPATVPAPILPRTESVPPSRTVSWTQGAPWLVTGVVLLAVLSLSRWLLPQNASPVGQAAAEFYHDFRGSKSPSPFFKWTGVEGEEVLEPEEKGLRIKLLTSRKGKYPAGLLLTFEVKGNFEITAGYEILQEAPPLVGSGVGFELYLRSDTPNNVAVALSRVLRPDGSQQYACNHMAFVEGKRRSSGRNFPASASAGRLRIGRSGKEITFAAAEGVENNFQELCRYKLGPEDLKTVRVGAIPGNSSALVDVRLVDLRVRSDSMTPDPNTAGTPASAGGAPAVPKAWLVVVELVGLTVVLVLIGLGVWLYVRRRGSAVKPAANASAEAAPAQPAVAAALVTFPCSECGKTIKVKTEQAGKRGKCPQCGKVLIVPAEAR